MQNSSEKHVTFGGSNTALPAVFSGGRKLIAHYMGEGAIGGYHQSWDWLMPAV